jgi:hypothetical protein
MIIPGTYVNVRSEGLISAGRIATGIVGVVGTASNGPVDVPTTLAGFGDAVDQFGPPDDFARPDDPGAPLTLVRALSHLYGNGASTIIAVRVASGDRAAADFALKDGSNRTVATLTARSPGTWAHAIAVTVDESPQDCSIEAEAVAAPFERLGYSGIVASPQTRIRLVRGTTRQARNLIADYKRVLTTSVPARPGNRFVLPELPVENVPSVNRIRILDADGSLLRQYAEGSILYGAGAPPAAGEVRVLDDGELIFEAGQVPTATQRVAATYAVGHDAPQPGHVLITTWDGRLTFAAGEAPSQADGDTLTASYLLDRANCVRVTLTHGATLERYVTPDGRILAAAVNAASRLATAAADATSGHRLPVAVTSFFGSGSNRAGNSGARPTADDYAAGLARLADLMVNIVVLAGQDAASQGGRIADVLVGHLNSTAESDHERIGVIGAPGSDLGQFLSHTLAHERVVVVAPGLRTGDGATFPTGYAAAAVAGLISSLPVQGSLTNRVVNVPGLSASFNRGQQEQLIGRNLLALADKEGFRVVKGVTTAGQGTPFSAIPTRRIVDFAKYGVRSGANSYIGRLNNDRVRSALKATLDAFLTRMVEDEALTAYELEVSATRAQEIAGEVSVVMILQPTFSIEYIRVTMILR